MAIIKIGPPLSGIRGTIGGITYSENGSGTYAKLWARGPNPRTSKQTIERSYLAQMPELWRGLTDAQRADWRTFAADPAQELTNPLGEAYYASGINWFAKCTVRLFRVGRGMEVDAPNQARPAAPTIDDFRVCVAGTESDLCTCGVASASSEEVLHPADHAFDDILVTYWRALAPLIQGWIRYDLCDAANVKHYAIYSAFAANTKYAKDWTFQVWTGAAWITLHTVTDMVWQDGTWHHFYCANPYTETDYRINISANQGHATNLEVIEIEFYAGDEGASVICYPEDDFSNAPVYDLVLHVSMGRSIGMWVQYPGYLEILAKQSPGRWFQLFQTELEAAFGTILDQRSWFARLYRQTQEGLRSSAQTARTLTIGA